MRHSLGSGSGPARSWRRNYENFLPHGSFLSNEALFIGQAQQPVKPLLACAFPHRDC
jgi:hypothetical protein